MKKNLFSKIAIAVLFTMVSFSLAIAQNATKVVTNLYKAHKIKSVAVWSKIELNKYFAPDLSAAIYQAANDESGIDFDILYNTQDDSDITNFKVGDEDSYYDSNNRTLYTVTATFKNFGKKKEVFFTIDPDSLKIEDISYYGLDESLMEILTGN